MNNENHPNLKMRFRLPNGEEFEAEGPLEFIEAQRNYFLTLIGHKGTTSIQTRPLFANTTQPAAANEQPTQTQEEYLWEHLFNTEGHTLVLRKRTKLPMADIVLLVLAAARVLFKQPSYSALELSRSLKAMGIEGGRLDRLLAGELQSGRILAQGSKRGRTYQLSNEGIARAFVLSNKLVKE